MDKDPGDDITAEEKKAAGSVYVALNSNAAQAALIASLAEQLNDHYFIIRTRRFRLAEQGSPVASRRWRCLAWRSPH